MKPIDVNNGRKNLTACAFCEAVTPKSGGVGIDVRKFTCIAPGGTISVRCLIDEPCSMKDSKECGVLLELQRGKT